MSRTYKNQHRSDGWHVGCRLRRQARPAGRVMTMALAELAAEANDDGPGPIVFEPAGPETFDPVPDRCGCSCRRCLLHDDCGGCLTGHGLVVL